MTRISTPARLAPALLATLLCTLLPGCTKRSTRDEIAPAGSSSDANRQADEPGVPNMAPRGRDPLFYPVDTGWGKSGTLYAICGKSILDPEKAEHLLNGEPKDNTVLTRAQLAELDVACPQHQVLWQG